MDTDNINAFSIASRNVRLVCKMPKWWFYDGSERNSERGNEKNRCITPWKCLNEKRQTIWRTKESINRNKISYVRYWNAPAKIEKSKSISRIIHVSFFSLYFSVEQEWISSSKQVIESNEQGVKIWCQKYKKKTKALLSSSQKKKLPIQVISFGSIYFRWNTHFCGVK